MSEKSNQPGGEALQLPVEMCGVTVAAMRDASFTVIEDVNWSVAAGEFWVIAGQEHSGKSDLLMLAAGLMTPTTGTCKLFGNDTKDFGEAELAERLRVGFVFQGGKLFNQLTVAENIALPLRYQKNFAAADALRETQAVAGTDGTHAAGRCDAGKHCNQLAATGGARAGVDPQAGSAAAGQSADRPGRAASAMVAAVSRPACHSVTNCSVARR